jgi:hypothetical protein
VGYVLRMKGERASKKALKGYTKKEKFGWQAQKKMD